MAKALHIVLTPDVEKAVRELPRGFGNKFFRKAFTTFIESPEGKAWLEAAKELG